MRSVKASAAALMFVAVFVSLVGCSGEETDPFATGATNSPSGSWTSLSPVPSGSSRESQSSYSPSFTHPYEYSLDPERDADEWAARMSDGTLDEALQIPVEVLESMPTDDLIDAVLDYPFWGDIYAFGTPEAGLDVVRERFSAVDALLTRPDAAGALVDRYQALDVAVADENNDDATLRIEGLELLLAQPEVLEKLDTVGRALLMQAVLEKQVEKADVFGSPGWSSNTTLMLKGRALALDDREFAERVAADSYLSDFLATGNPVAESAEDWQAIIDEIETGVADTYGVTSSGAGG